MKLKGMKLELRSMTIRTRLLLLIGIQAAVLAVIGGITATVLNYALETTTELNQRVSRQARLIDLADGLRTDLVDAVQAVNVGSITWPEARQSLAFARDDFDSGWRAYRESLDPAESGLANATLSPWVEGVRRAFDALEPILQEQNRRLLTLYVSNDLDAEIGPFLDALVATTSLQQLEAGRSVSAAAAAGRVYMIAGWLAFAIGLGLALGLGAYIYRSIAVPVRHISATVRKVSDGDFEARTGVRGEDELGALGQAFDTMLNDRVATLSRAQEENERLNESVIALLQAVSRLSQRDLTVRVPVTEDVTGPVADALNLLTNETATVLAGVREISGNVALASQQVKAQADRVIALARSEQSEIDDAAGRLGHASNQMTAIAKLARASAEAAEHAIDSTRTAMKTVTDTVSGINSVRDTIREAEKRIKRLGERSQEISGVVNLINSIAERTHILALNASMHAASAGEAGRGFAVVADEVQRLAENAREATAQIGTLVNNIQVDTADTVTTMNEVIERVVSGSQLAEQAGTQMAQTSQSTESLVLMVKKIAIGSAQQAKTSVELRKRADLIRQSSQETSSELQAQTQHTYHLVEHARSLLDAVGVFRLPGAAVADTAEVFGETGRVEVAELQRQRASA